MTLNIAQLRELRSRLTVLAMVLSLAAALLIFYGVTSNGALPLFLAILACGAGVVVVSILSHVEEEIDTWVRLMSSHTNRKSD